MLKGQILLLTLRRVKSVAYTLRRFAVGFDAPQVAEHDRQFGRQAPFVLALRRGRGGKSRRGEGEEETKAHGVS